MTRIPVPAVALAAAGALFLWSAARGVSISGSLRALLAPPRGAAPGNDAAPDGRDTTDPAAGQVAVPGTHPLTSGAFW